MATGKENIIYWANQNLQDYFALHNEYLGPDMDIIVPDPATEETRPLPEALEWPKEYVVQEGDTLRKIAVAFYEDDTNGNKRSWIFFFNDSLKTLRYETGEEVRVGDIIQIPDPAWIPWPQTYTTRADGSETIQTVSKWVYDSNSRAKVIYWENQNCQDYFAEHNTYIGANMTVTIPDPATEAPELPEPVPEWPKSYTTQPGDTIEDIADAYYGDPTKANVIYWANANLQAYFAENREYVGPFMAITIPDPATEAEPLPPIPEWPKSYTTAQGDTIERVSELFYDVDTKGNIIYWANANLQEYFAAHNVYVGAGLSITIPDPATVEDRPLPTPLPEWPKYYDTIEGENIWAIAAKFYDGDDQKANIIFWNNQALLLDHFYMTGEYMLAGIQIMIPDPTSTSDPLPGLWPRSYVTQPGDTIYSVAYQQYEPWVAGDPSSKANIIYWNNGNLQEFFRKNNEYLDDNYATITIPDPTATSDPLPAEWPKYWTTLAGETIWSVAYDYYSKVIASPTDKANVIYWNNEALQEYHRISMTEYLGPDKYIVIPNPSSTSDPLPAHWPKYATTTSDKNIYGIAYDYYAGDTTKANIIFWNNPELIAHWESTGQYVKPGITITIPDIASTSDPLPYPGT